MATVTYKNQPAIHATRGAIPLAGTSHLYTVKKDNSFAMSDVYVWQGQTYFGRAQIISVFDSAWEK